MSDEITTEAKIVIAAKDLVWEKIDELISAELGTYKGMESKEQIRNDINIALVGLISSTKEALTRRHGTSGRNDWRAKSTVHSGSKVR